MGLRLVGEVSLDGAGFERGLARLGEAAASSLKSMVIGAVGVYGLEQAMQRTVETADELVTSSKRLGLTVEQLQTLRQAAKDNNVEFTALAGAFEKLDVAREKALGGGRGAEQYLQAFERLGINAADLQSKTAAELFQTQIAATVKMTNPEQIAAPLREIFGRAFGDLVPVLKTDFEELGSRMKEVGAIMDTDTAVKLKVMGDELSLLSTVITAQIGPALVQFSMWLLQAVEKIKQSANFWGKLQVEIQNRFGQSASVSALMLAYQQYLVTAANAEKLKNLYGRPARDDVGYFAAAQGVDYNAFQKFNDAVMAASGQVIDESKSSTDFLNKMLGKFAALQNLLENPVVNFGGGNWLSGSTGRARSFQNSGDSLVSVGNFLGANAGAINNIAERHLQVAREQLTQLNIIAKNTSWNHSPADGMAGIEWTS